MVVWRGVPGHTGTAGRPDIPQLEDSLHRGAGDMDAWRRKAMDA